MNKKVFAIGAAVLGALLIAGLVYLGLNLRQERQEKAELEALARRVVSGEVRYCPHGRPVSVKLTKAELDRQLADRMAPRLPAWVREGWEGPSLYGPDQRLGEAAISFLLRYSRRSASSLVGYQQRTGRFAQTARLARSSSSSSMSGVRGLS